MVVTGYSVAPRLWHFATRVTGVDVSWRNIRGIRANKPTIIAIGGNSIDGAEVPTARNILNVFRRARNEGRGLVITHGNGPQVGQKLDAAEAAEEQLSIAEATRETQAEIGTTLKANLLKQDPTIGEDNIVIIETRVIVADDDPAFNQLTKYIGKEYSLEYMTGKGATQQSDGLWAWTDAESGQTWLMKEASSNPGYYQRVVASPKPLAIQEDDLAAIRAAMADGKIVIAVGGGGIPILEDESAPQEESVIDKDLASALLCRELEAKEFIISTGVSHVTHRYGMRPKWLQRKIHYYQAAHAEKNLWKEEYILTKNDRNKIILKKKPRYTSGNIREKIEAMTNALRFGVNKVLITNPEADWEKDEGTIGTRGWDILNRFQQWALNYPTELRRYFVI
ncbi:MAG: hypothetical protein ABH823_04575 [bacterium]